MTTSAYRAVAQKTVFAAAVIAALVLTRVPLPAAQGVSIAFSKYNGQAWPAGPDYATDVLGDPWDFSENGDTADVFPDPGELTSWQTLFLNGNSYPRQGTAGGHAGMVGGRTVNQNGQPSTINLLFRGRYGILNPDRTGRQFPIDTSRYQKMSYRMNSSAGGFGGWVLWFPFAWNDPALPPSDPNDGGGRFAPLNAAGNAIHAFDLTSGAFGRSWTSTPVVRGLRIAPNLGRWGDDIFYDWVRLTAPDASESAAHMQRISWGGSGSATIQVVDSANTVLTIATGVTATTYLWNYGVLPPGSYTLQIVRSNVVVGSKVFTIAAPPIVTLTSPNKTGDENYATTVLGNAWDMNESSDVIVTGQFDHYTPQPAFFSGGVMTATQTTNDPQIWLLDHNFPANKAIDTSRYRYFTIRYMLEDNNVDPWGIGRVFWSASEFLNAGNATDTKDIDIWPGYHTYTVDLATLNTGADGGLEPDPSAVPWTSSAMRSFRFDPSEYDVPVAFHVDYIKLGAMAETTNGGYTFRWTSTGSSSAQVSLYLDNDTNPSNGKTLIASGIAMNAGQYFWPQNNTAPGDYFVYTEANDGLQTYGRYGEGKLRVLNVGPVSHPAMAVDTPFQGATVDTTFPVSGWAVDTGATSGVGVDLLHIWAFPEGSNQGTFLAQVSPGSPRTDIGNAYGSQFTNSGFSTTVTLPAGQWYLLVYSHSTVTGAFSQVIGHHITVRAPATDPYTRIDTPAFTATASASAPLTISGWAIDRGATSGTGVTDIHVWAFPDGVNEGPQNFVDVAHYGELRDDVGRAFGSSQFDNSGYSLTVPAGRFQAGRTYFIVVFGRSSVTQGFTQSAGAWVTFN